MRQKPKAEAQVLTDKEHVNVVFIGHVGKQDEVPAENTFKTKLGLIRERGERKLILILAQSDLIT